MNRSLSGPHSMSGNRSLCGPHSMSGNFQRDKKKFLAITGIPSPPSSAVVKERVELYFCSPYGPYRLYRASVPVQGCILPFYLQEFEPRTV
jgi:hypothetical protein